MVTSVFGAGINIFLHKNNSFQAILMVAYIYGKTMQGSLKQYSLEYQKL